MNRLGNIYTDIVNAGKSRQKKFAVLIDPDKSSEERLGELLQLGEQCGVDYYLVGGSLMMKGRFQKCLKTIKQLAKIPVVLFPGSTMQISKHADAILLLSLISGRNPELLIGRHVEAAPKIKSARIEPIPVGYMLIDGGQQTAVSYMSNTLPIPADKTDIAVATALAGEMLGLKAIYLDAGSGAKKAVSNLMIKRVRQAIDLPLIVGGGIRTAEKAADCCKAGADIVVVGNAIEQDLSLVMEMSQAIHSFNSSAIIKT